MCCGIRFTLLVWLGIALTTALLPARAGASTFKPLDLKLVEALKEPPSRRALELFGEADQMLNAIHKQRKTPKSGSTDLDVTVRASLIDALRDVIALDMQNATLESIRTQVKALDLVRSLWEAAGANQAERTQELDLLVNAHYDRVVRTGAQDRNASVKYGVPDAEELVYRVFVQREGGLLSAFELGGDRRQRRATWRESPLPSRAEALLEKAATIIGNPRSKNSLFPAGAQPFVLLVAGDLADADARTESAIAEIVDKLPPHGIVPLMIEADERKQPFLLLPGFAVGPELRAALRGAGAAMFHRASGAQLVQWANTSTLRDLTALSAGAIAIAEEVLGDLGRDNARPAGGAKLSSLVDVPVAVGGDFATRALTSVAGNVAARVDGGRPIQLKPGEPLVLKAMLPGTEWGQYALGSVENETLVWLKRDQVQAYVLPESIDEEANPLTTESKPRGRPSKSWYERGREFFVGDDKKNSP